MTAHIIDKLLFLIIVVTIAHILWRFYPYRVEKGLRKEAQPEICAPLQQEVVLAVTSREEITAAPLFSRHLSDNATLTVRPSATRKTCTAQLIVRSGRKRRGSSERHYVLGVHKLGELPGSEVTDEIVEEFLAIAKEQLNEIVLQGKRKRRAVKPAIDEAVMEVAKVTTEAISVVAEQKVDVPQVSVEDSPPESIKLKKFPSVYRGIIKEVGMMKQSKDGREFETFGVRYETQEGIVDAVFGVNLRDALREAQADVGDQVEILKIGRKTIEKGRAPMNLFKVAKL